jgi:hypothetical protein
MDEAPNYSRTFFYIGLFGIVVSGLLVGIGGGNYWGSAHALWFTPPGATGRYTALLFVVALYVCACDIVALGVIFAGAVIIVQRLRGRI